MNAQTAAAFDDDRTLFFRPVLAQAATTAAVDVAPVDVREIGAFGAINPVIAAANPLLMMVPTLRTAAAPSDGTAACGRP
jgi:type VI protein secretion system component VasF